MSETTCHPSYDLADTWRRDPIPFKEFTVSVRTCEVKDGPCPSCGAQAVLTGYLTFTRKLATVRCPACGTFDCHREAVELVRLARTVRPGRKSAVARMRAALNERGFDASPLDVHDAWVAYSESRGNPFGWHDHTKLDDEQLYYALTENLTEPD